MQGNHGPTKRPASVLSATAKGERRRRGPSMRPKIAPASPLMPLYVNRPQARHLRQMSKTLDAHPEMEELVLKDLVRGLKEPEQGRPGMSARQVLRVSGGQAAHRPELPRPVVSPGRLGQQLPVLRVRPAHRRAPQIRVAGQPGPRDGHDPGAAQCCDSQRGQRPGGGKGEQDADRLHAWFTRRSTRRPIRRCSGMECGG